jgi:hypothetical protein
MICHCSDGHFFFLRALLLKKQKRDFSVKRHFVVECSYVESAANVCGSEALQAAITVIAACVVLLLLL